MKLKPLTLVVLAYSFAAAACSPVGQAYWQPVNSNSTAGLTPSQTDALLNKNLAACTSAIDEMNKRNAVQANAGDFDDCMQGEGWKRQGIAPPNPQWLKADDHQYMPSAPPTAKVYDDKQQIAVTVREDDLVPLGGKITVGVQGYQDRYNESTAGVNIHTNYYGGVAGYTYRYDTHNFLTIEGRLAGGKESYNSPSGTIGGVPEYEGEARLMVGHDYALENSWLSPYVGIGTRIFRGDGKGYFSNTGAFDYDRRIEQLYVPFGATWRTLLPGNFTMADTLEAEPLLIGSVNSREQDEGGPNLVNTQDFLSGYGVRGSVMFGVPVDNETIEFGPFFRYWNVNDSTFNVQHCGPVLCSVLYEPYNTRLQIGVTAGVSF